MQAAVPYHYRLFGLVVASDVPLPEAVPSADVHEADVRIPRGQIGFPPTAAGLMTIDGDLLLTVPEVGRYLIRGGIEIVVDAEPGAADKNVRLYLLGSGMGSLLHQRGLLPLHANAVDIGGRAVAFIGKSGAGKSTLACRFHDRGHTILSDDVCVVRQARDGQFVVDAGVRRLRLCRDALVASGRRADDFEPSFLGDAEFDKFDVPLDAHSNVGSLTLAAVVVLDFANDESVQVLAGSEAAETLFAHTYRGLAVEQVGTSKSHWQAVVSLLSLVPVLRWARPKNLTQMDEGIDRLIEALPRYAGEARTKPLRVNSDRSSASSASH